MLFSIRVIWFTSAEEVFLDHYLKVLATGSIVLISVIWKVFPLSILGTFKIDFRTQFMGFCTLVLCIWALPCQDFWCFLYNAWLVFDWEPHLDCSSPCFMCLLITDHDLLAHSILHLSSFLLCNERTFKVFGLFIMVLALETDSYSGDSVVVFYWCPWHIWYSGILGFMKNGLLC